MMNDKTETVKARIAAVLAKTKENGATEDEAIAAARLARILMEKHSLTLEDIADRKIARDDFVEGQASFTTYHPCDCFLAVQIAKYTQTKGYFIREAGVHFFGYSPDVELAKFIYQVSRSACETLWDKYKVRLQEEHRTKVNREAYMTGVADKIAYRIWKLLEEEPPTTGTDLIVLKNQLVEAAFADQNYQHVGQVVLKDFEGESWMGGWVDGDKVNFHRELGGKTKAIGR